MAEEHSHVAYSAGAIMTLVVPWVPTVCGAMSGKHPLDLVVGQGGGAEGSRGCGLDCAVWPLFT